jgi:hypothetical protein
LKLFSFLGFHPDRHHHRRPHHLLFSFSMGQMLVFYLPTFLKGLYLHHLSRHRFALDALFLIAVFFSVFDFITLKLDAVNF